MSAVGPAFSGELDRDAATVSAYLEDAGVAADAARERFLRAHLVWSMLRPTRAAVERLDDFWTTGIADLGTVRLRREGRAGVLELRNPRHLNAEDDATLPATEIAVDLALLDPEIEVGVFRGGLVDHPRYAGRRIFGAGINLTLLGGACQLLHVMDHVIAERGARLFLPARKEGIIPV